MILNIQSKPVPSVWFGVAYVPPPAQDIPLAGSDSDALITGSDSDAAITGSD